MSRFIQEPRKKEKSKKEKKKERVLPRAGSYTTADIENAKKIYSSTGGKI